MCGIFGFVTDHPSKVNVDLFQNVFDLSSIRGTDASGMAYVHEDKIVCEKAAIDTDKFLEKSFPQHIKDLCKTQIIMGHTRKWTQGKPEDNNNNHPIYSDHWFMVHNGTCSNMDRIKDYKYHGEVDSEILLSYVEKYGLEKGLPNLVGNGAVALMHINEPKAIYLWRHNEPIIVAYDRGSQTIFFGSTDTILENGLQNEMCLFSTFQRVKLPEDTLYRLSVNPLKLEEIAIVEINRPKYSGRDYSTAYSNYRDEYRGWPNYEWSSGTGSGSKGNSQGPIAERVAALMGKTRTLLGSYTFDEEKQALVCTDLLKKKDPQLLVHKAENDTTIKNRFYFTKARQSMDFIHWSKVDPLRGSRYYRSLDKVLVKIWDKTALAHFIMTYSDAIEAGLIKEEETKNE